MKFVPIVSSNSHLLSVTSLTLSLLPIQFSSPSCSYPVCQYDFLTGISIENGPHSQHFPCHPRVPPTTFIFCHSHLVSLSSGWSKWASTGFPLPLCSPLPQLVSLCFINFSLWVCLPTRLWAFWGWNLTYLSMQLHFPVKTCLLFGMSQVFPPPCLCLCHSSLGIFSPIASF